MAISPTRRATGTLKGLAEVSSGAPWLLLRGFIREQGHWLDFPDRLAAQVKAPVHLLDLPGSGDLRHLKVPSTVSEVTDILRLERERRGLPTSFRVLALSLGGMVALDWAARFPSEIEKMVIVNSSLGNLSPFYQRLNWRIYGQFFAAALAQSSVGRERRVLKMVSQSLQARALAEPEWTAIRDQRPVSALQAIRQLAVASRAKTPELELKTPVLWLRSLGDRLVDPSCTLKLHRHFGGTTADHPWAGHDLTLDDPDWTILQIQRWLGE